MILPRPLLALLLLTVAGLVLLFTTPLLTGGPSGVSQQSVSQGEVAAGGGGSSETREDEQLLAGYDRYWAAVADRDHATLEELALADDSYLAYRSAFTLARSMDLQPAQRLRFYHRTDELRLSEPLARTENRSFYLEYATVAEAAGDQATALRAYREALPEPMAAGALARLVEDPYELANIYRQEGRNREALAALEDLSAPSIEAGAYRALGEYVQAKEAYGRWLEQSPGSVDALSGLAWTHFYLEEYEEADELFAGLQGSNAAYGRGLIAGRLGDIPGAVEFMRESGEPYHLWIATGWLEARDEYAEAIPVYLQLARTRSAYADDGAYRAYVLATRLGDQQAADEALSLLPGDSFFRLVLGEERQLEFSDDLPAVDRLPVQDLADALVRRNDLDAARGELSFALRTAPDEAHAVSLAGHLQRLGEFRYSGRAAQLLVNGGSTERETWKAAYPRAFAEVVETAARQFDVEEHLVWAVMKQESAFYPRAVSTSNARGLMQVVPSTWDWLAELLDEEPGEPFDPVTNIRYGTYYLRWLLNYFDGDEELAIASYNRGQGYIGRLFATDYVAGDKDELYREIDALETREYLQNVILHLHTYRPLSGS